MFLHEITEENFDSIIDEITLEEKINLIILFDESLEDEVNNLWLWNKSFYDVKNVCDRIICTGKRCNDLCLKLKMDGCEDLVSMCDDIDMSFSSINGSRYNTHIMYPSNSKTLLTRYR
ncbi:MAG: MurT ligase domain-containing protein [Bacilli bacterium]